ncbi:unnamed protein product, partial [Brenthis ino]
MYSLKRNTPFKHVWSFLRLYSSGRRTHYEVLNLHKTCTDKEIKDAFIQMSKEYHPDKNKSSKAQENFVRIVEAYNVLGKPSSRAQYDQMSEVEGYSYVYKTHVPYNLRKNPQYGYYNANTKSTNNTNSDSYYGVKGVHKIPNITLVMICFGVAIIGVILQVVVIRKRTQEKSIKLAEELERVRDAARGKTRDMQTQVLLDKIVTAANPSVATASLGQALAEEKK